MVKVCINLDDEHIAFFKETNIIKSKILRDLIESTPQYKNWLLRKEEEKKMNKDLEFIESRL